MGRGGYRITFVAFLFALIAFALPTPVVAELRIDITRGKVEPMPIAVPDFTGTGEAERFGQDLSQVLAADLERSGLFRPLDKKSFIQKTLVPNSLPRFGDWRVLNAQALVQGAIEVLPPPDNRLRVQFHLWDVFAEQQMAGFVYTTPKDGWRRVAHLVADAVYQRITGEKGYFDTRIVYIAESGPQTNRSKRLSIMDQDGANHRFLTDGKTLVLTPRFSPAAQDITYLSYFGNVPRVYVFNIDSGRQEVLGDFPGMTFAPRFSPDGRRVIMSMAKDGNTEIYTMDLATRAVKRLTDNSAIDTSPDYSPDASNIVFNSDRGGTQQLYTMRADGSDVRRISYGTGRYATPAWSPRGDLIAYTKIASGSFYIGVMRPDGTGERQLAEGFLVEGPTWAPNGRVLMFYRQNASSSRGEGARPRLYSIDLTGYNEREIVTPLEASDPAWSPLIPN